MKEAGGEVVRKKNRFDMPSSGYKDYLLNIRQPNGMVTELLLTTKAMSEAKRGVGHDLYEAMQIAEEVWNDENATEEERAEAWGYIVLLDDASVAYYSSTGDQSNATASLSGIVEPLVRISAMGAGLANSKLYPKL
ncbi:MAG: hypothetical protein LBB60_02995, partial [Desulfovibrio sp.]|nr:hypothetical protein [Desulfovibrio sp.]